MREIILKKRIGFMHSLTGNALLMRFFLPRGIRQDISSAKAAAKF
jgi:hypothetical protein